MAIGRQMADAPELVRWWSRHAHARVQTPAARLSEPSLFEVSLRLRSQACSATIDAGDLLRKRQRRGT